MTDKEMQILLWVLGGVGAVGLMIIVTSFSTIKTMIVDRFQALDGAMNAHFLEAKNKQSEIEKKIDDLRSELNSKVEEVRVDMHEIDKRLYIIEKDHARLTQCRYNGACAPEGGN